jgi:hypothetical protein
LVLPILRLKIKDYVTKIKLLSDNIEIISRHIPYLRMQIFKEKGFKGSSIGKAVAEDSRVQVEH